MSAKHIGRAHGSVWPACLVVMVALALVGLLPLGPSLLFLAATGMAWAVAAVGLDAFSGYLGQPSFGHAAFIGAGAYGSTILAGRLHWSLPVAMLGAVVAVAVLSALIGSVLLRLKEFGLVLGTFFLTFVSTSLLSGTLLAEWTGAASGLQTPQLVLAGSINLSDGVAYYYTCWAVLAIVALASAALVDATPGQLLRLVKRSDAVARSLAVNPDRVRLATFVWSATLAAGAGCLISLGAGYISPENFGVQASIMLFAMVAVGGLGSIAGPVVGAVALTALPSQLQFAQTGQQVLFASLLLIVFVAGRGGLYGAANSLIHRFGLDLRWPRPAARRPALGGAEDIDIITGDAAAPAGLDVEGVSLSYGGVHALKGVTFSVEPGSVHALVGPNGAGKTSLLNCVSGLEAPQSGSINLNNRGGPESDGRRTLHRTFQHQALVSDLTVLENVALGLYRDRGRLGRNRSGAKVVPARAHAALIAVGVAPARHHLAGSELSMAESKLVDLARGLVGSPAVLVLDEPTAGLSAEEMGTISDVITHLNRQSGLTILVVSHHVGWIRTVTHRATVLVAGRVLADGTTEDVLASKETRRAFLGEVPDGVAS
ncbi:ATP-binding cassette domain-containing protein [Intrasporangium sp. DVR]|uniref:branched-chain amino acid ABC transporter ATP-binding protein/permease n=1 Tax=Intrasporangium sp. DVR TaxID=3127867 RepID=UPI00313A55EA